jgi:hypothetical protein
MRPPDFVSQGYRGVCASGLLAVTEEQAHF